MPGYGDEGPSLEGMAGGRPEAFATRADLAGLIDQTRLNLEALSSQINRSLDELSRDLGAGAAEAIASHGAALRAQDAAICDLFDAVRRLQGRVAAVEADVAALKVVLGWASREGLVEIRVTERKPGGAP